MSKNKTRIPHKFLPWIDARKKYCLSHRHIQMARELGMNPKRFANMANTENKPWKLPLPKYIESLYLERFENLKKLAAAAVETGALGEAAALVL